MSRASKLIAIFLCATPCMAHAQLLLTHAGQGISTPPYTPSGVHFGYYTSLGTSSALTSSGTAVPGGDTGAAAATSKGTISFWVRGTRGNSTATGTNITNGDHIANQGNGTFSSEGVPGIDFSFDNSAGNYGTLRVNLGDASATAANAGGAHSCNWQSTGAVLTDSSWHHYLMSFDVSGTSSTAKNLAVYKDGVKLGSGGCTYGATSAMSVAVNNAAGFAIMAAIASNQHGVNDLADVVVDLTNSIVDGSNNISAGNIAKVYSAGPVALPTNCALWGSTPQFCGSGNKTGFATNKGTATGLALSGTNDGTLYDASFGPAGAPAHTAVQNWSYAQTIGSSIATVTTNAAGAAINQNDLLIAILVIEDSDIATGNHNPTCPTGFTALTYTVGSNPSWANGATDDPTDVLSCYKVAGAGETGAYAFNWTTNNTRGGYYALFDFSGEDTSTPIDKASLTVNGGAALTTSHLAPSLTTLAYSNDTLLSFWTTYDPLKLTLPAGSNLLTGSLVSSGTTAVRAGFEYLASSAATGTRTLTSASNTAGQGISIAIKAN